MRVFANNRYIFVNSFDDTVIFLHKFYFYFCYLCSLPLYVIKPPPPNGLTRTLKCFFLEKAYFEYKKLQCVFWEIFLNYIKSYEFQSRISLNNAKYHCLKLQTGIYYISI